ncbi:MAG: hypothetical protein JO102_01100 [Elusimicrobia bacterium]|nr:hypothetical protein [Elusimicrobiota bacterium]
MTLGTFDYAKELICRQLNMKQDESEKGQGLRELQAAYHGGVYFRIPSGVLLAGLLTNESPPDAIPVLKELRQELPESPFIHIVYVTALYNAGQIPDMEREAADFLVKAESGPYVGYKPQAYFAEGLLAFRREKWADAAASFHRASDSGPEENPYTTWSMLYEGYCYDALGERAKAKERYEAVVARKPRYASHERAKMRLDSPFKRTDVEMRKVEL